mmetsp:Transcript_34563/g.73638  ORF Transcript_34563/g.73638 Transcript_34563/m.73638 type:complete len:214 (-) Transcript_34563:206-847(-)
MLLGEREVHLAPAQGHPLHGRGILRGIHAQSHLQRGVLEHDGAHGGVQGGVRSQGDFVRGHPEDVLGEPRSHAVHGTGKRSGKPVPLGRLLLQRRSTEADRGEQGGLREGVGGEGDQDRNRRRVGLRQVRRAVVLRRAVPPAVPREAGGEAVLLGAAAGGEPAPVRDLGAGGPEGEARAGAAGGILEEARSGEGVLRREVQQRAHFGELVLEA